LADTSISLKTMSKSVSAMTGFRDAMNFCNINRLRL